MSRELHAALIALAVVWTIVGLLLIVHSVIADGYVYHLLNQ